MADGDSMEADRPYLCEGSRESAIVIEVDEEGNESYEVVEEGYACPNEPVGEFELETRGGPPMAFWLCEECREIHSEHIIEVLEEVTNDD